MSEIKAVAPVVSIADGKITTTSRNVAEVFGKEHCNVIRSIEQLKGNCPESFSALNFEAAEYQDGQNKPRPMYHLTRNGLVLLVMGFTGDKALEFKIAYIEAFDRMEEELRRREAAEAPRRGPGRPPKALPWKKDCTNELAAWFDANSATEDVLNAGFRDLVRKAMRVHWNVFYKKLGRPDLVFEQYNGK